MGKQTANAAGKYHRSYTDTCYDMSCILTIRKVRGQQRENAKASAASRQKGKRNAEP